MLKSALAALLSPLLFLLFAAPAAAQFDSSEEPIDITSDRLEVFQEEKRAVFTGDVVAIQGEARLAAKKLVVHFDSVEDGEWGDIERMRAEGGVRYATPTEVATGQWAVYEAGARTITFHERVVVNRGDNVLRGAKLTVNVDTNQSVMESGSENGANGRVRGLFFTGGQNDPSEES
ncbi:MAG: LptA/OstA family protein [Pseudomonadota bacterium]